MYFYALMHRKNATALFFYRTLVVLILLTRLAVAVFLISTKCIKLLVLQTCTSSKIITVKSLEIVSGNL